MCIQRVTINVVWIGSLFYLLLPLQTGVCEWSWSSRPVGFLTFTASGTSLTAPGSSLTSRVTSATIASFLNLGIQLMFCYVRFNGRE